MLGVMVVAQLAISAYAPDTITACDAVEVTVAVSRRGTAVPTLVAPTLAPFDVLRRSSTWRIDPGAQGGSPLAGRQGRGRARWQRGVPPPLWRAASGEPGTRLSGATGHSESRRGRRPTWHSSPAGTGGVARRADDPPR